MQGQGGLQGSHRLNGTDGITFEVQTMAACKGSHVNAMCVRSEFN